jgi:hypothetical protein
MLTIRGHKGLANVSLLTNVITLETLLLNQVMQGRQNAAHIASGVPRVDMISGWRVQHLYWIDT